jgi:hypothetical protein
MRQTRTDIEPAHRNQPAEPASQDATALRHYLLGELAPPDVEAIENRLFEDDELFELAEAIEAELLDAEARGELAPAPESPLSKLGHSAWGRRRRDFSGALAAIDLPAALTVRDRFVAAAKRAAPALALAASLVGAVGLVHHIILGIPDPPTEGTESIPNPTEISPKAPQAPPMEIHLVAPSLRSLQGSTPFPVPEKTEDVLLILDVTGEEATTFDVKIQNSRTERVIWRFTNVDSKGQPDGGRELSLPMKARLLPPGSYLVELRRVGSGDNSEPLNSRGFKIVRP